VLYSPLSITYIPYNVCHILTIQLQITTYLYKQDSLKMQKSCL